MAPAPTTPRLTLAALALALVACGQETGAGNPVAGNPVAGNPVADNSDAGVPPTLSATGLHAPGVRTFTPRFPLWTDGARKQRWVRLPEGAVIDGSDPAQWRLPVGTQLWKEFSFEGRIETRYMERRADGWRYATYVWAPGATDAVLAPARGLRGACKTALGTRHDVPSELDCRACHDAHPSGALGFSAVQLAARREAATPHVEPLKPGDLGLEELLATGLVSGDHAALRAASEPFPAGAHDHERAALGYLHANCSGCHNARGPLASLGLDLELAPAEVPAATRTTVGVASRYRPRSDSAAVRVAAGDPDASALVQRMSTRFPAAQMPPLGTGAVDRDGVALVRDWIQTCVVPHAQSSGVAAATVLEHR